MPRVAAAAVLLLVLAAAASPASAQERTFEETVALDPGGRLSLDASRGSVRLTSWDRPEVEIRARITPPPNAEAGCAQDAVDAAEIDVRARDGAVRIRTEHDEAPACRGWRRWFGGRGGWQSRAHVHYEISAPRELQLDLDINRADTVLDGFGGRIRLAANRIRLEATALSGEIYVELNRGQIDGRDLEGDVRLDLNRSQGTLAGFRGSLDLDANRTDVTASGMRIDGDSVLDVNRGAVELGLAEDQALTVDARTNRSGISSEMPATVLQRTDDTSYQAVINGGGPRLRIDANRGQIRLRAL